MDPVVPILNKGHHVPYKKASINVPCRLVVQSQRPDGCAGPPAGVPAPVIAAYAGISYPHLMPVQCVVQRLGGRGGSGRAERMSGPCTRKDARHVGGRPATSPRACA